MGLPSKKELMRLCWLFLTLGVNMILIPSAAPSSSNALTRKHKRTTYGNKELKYKTWGRRYKQTLGNDRYPWKHFVSKLSEASFLKAYVQIRQLRGTHIHRSCIYPPSIAWSMMNLLLFRQVTKSHSSPPLWNSSVSCRGCAPLTATTKGLKMIRFLDGKTGSDFLCL